MNMKKNKSSMQLALVAVIGLGACLYIVSASSQSVRTESTATSPGAKATPAQQAPAKSTGTATGGSGNTYHSLLTQTGNYECDYSQVQSSGQAKNVIYLSGGKMRAEFRSTSSGVGTSNLAVYDGHYLYEWQEGFSTGTKTVLTSLSQLPAAIPTDLTSGKIYGSSYESVGWLCHPWSADASLLAPPSYVTFTAAS